MGENVEIKDVLDENDPDMKFLDSWEETMKYVRWEK